MKKCYYRVNEQRNILHEIRKPKANWLGHIFRRNCFLNEEVLLRVNERRNILHEIRKRKANWIGHILRRDCLLNEEVLLRVNEQRNILHEIRKLKANWIGHILYRNCLLKHVIEGNMERRIDWKEDVEEEVSSYRKTLREGRGYWKFKDDALRGKLFRNGFDVPYGPFVGETNEWMDFSFGSFSFTNKCRNYVGKRRFSFTQRCFFLISGYVKENVWSRRKYICIYIYICWYLNIKSGAIFSHITILPVVFYGCETWSLTLREELRLECLKIGCWGEYLGLIGMR